MKNRKSIHSEDDYLLFKNRLSIKMLLMIGGAILIIGVVYLLVIKDNFANAAVAILDRLIYHPPEYFPYSRKVLLKALHSFVFLSDQYRGFLQSCTDN